MNLNELEKISDELLWIREGLTNRPLEFLPEAECRIEAVSDLVVLLHDGTKRHSERLLEVIRVLEDLSTLCAHAREFYGGWVGTLSSIAGEYDGAGVPSFAPFLASRVAARG